MNRGTGKTVACEKEFKEFVDAGTEWSRVQMALSSIFPAIPKPLSETEDVVPTVLTQEMLDQARDLRAQEGPAFDEYLRAGQVYQDCKKASGE